MHDARSLNARLPKCDFYVHMEGSREPEMMFAVARRKGIRLPYESVDALLHAYQFRNLQDFPDHYCQGMSVLVAAQDFYDYVGDNCSAMSDAPSLGREEITAIAPNSVQASLLASSEKAMLQTEIDHVLSETA